MGLIDLHTHTNFSDGTDSPQELIQKAVHRQIKILSITDHNTVSAYKKIDKDFLANNKIKLITGVELSVCYHNIAVEILGYGFDIAKMQQFIQRHYDMKTIISHEGENFSKAKAKLKELGFKISPGLQFKPPFCTEAFYTDLWRYPENIGRLPQKLNQYPELLYRYLTDPNSVFYAFDASYPDCHVVINGIHQAGGKAFLAHPYVYLVDNPIQLVRDMAAKTKLDGIEVFHPLHQQSHINSLLNLANRKNLLVSGGSDYHGDNKRNLDLATGYNKLVVPRQYIDWID